MSSGPGRRLPAPACRCRCAAFAVRPCAHGRGFGSFAQVARGVGAAGFGCSFATRSHAGEVRSVAHVLSTPEAVDGGSFNGSPATADAHHPGVGNGWTTRPESRHRRQNRIKGFLRAPRTRIRAVALDFTASHQGCASSAASMRVGSECSPLLRPGDGAVSGVRSDRAGRRHQHLQLRRGGAAHGNGSVGAKCDSNSDMGNHVPRSARIAGANAATNSTADSCRRSRQCRCRIRRRAACAWRPPDRWSRPSALAFRAGCFAVREIWVRYPSVPDYRLDSAKRIEQTS